MTDYTEEDLKSFKETIEKHFKYRLREEELPIIDEYSDKLKKIIRDQDRK